MAAAEAGGAEAALRMVGQLHHVAEAEIAERIHADDPGDLINRVNGSMLFPAEGIR